MVLATQNPVEQEGVYRLPEAQLDRFLLRVEMGYPGREREVAMLRAAQPARSPRSSQLFTADLDPGHPGPAGAASTATTTCCDYIVDLAEASREHPDVALGASPRASLCLLRCARRRALLDGRHYFTHEDVQAVAAGRAGPSPDHPARGRGRGQAGRRRGPELLESVPVLEARSVISKQ